jgi:hypothetical protein
MIQQHPNHESSVSNQRWDCEPQHAPADPFGVIEWAISAVDAVAMEAKGQAVGAVSVFGNLPAISYDAAQGQSQSLTEQDKSNAHVPHVTASQGE